MKTRDSQVGGLMNEWREGQFCLTGASCFMCFPRDALWFLSPPHFPTQSYTKILIIELDRVAVYTMRWQKLVHQIPLQRLSLGVCCSTVYIGGRLCVTTGLDPAILWILPPRWVTRFWQQDNNILTRGESDSRWLCCTPEPVFQPPWKTEVTRKYGGGEWPAVNTEQEATNPSWGGGTCLLKGRDFCLLDCGLDFECPTRSCLFLTPASSLVRRLLLFIRKVTIFFFGFTERLPHRDLYCHRYKITYTVNFTPQLFSLSEIPPWYHFINIQPFSPNAFYHPVVHSSPSSSVVWLIPAIGWSLKT